jgi:thiazole synthase
MIRKNRSQSLWQDNEMKDDSFELAGKRYRSRLIVGTGKYRDFAETRAAIEESGAEIVTVAVRRVNITDAGKENLLDYIDPKKYQILPNTAGCYTVEDAVRTCRLAREAGVGDLVKLEVIGDQATLFPDVPATLEAAKILVKDGFRVLPYITDDPVACLRLAEIGCAAVMPLAAPIGSGMGIRNPFNLRIIMEQAKVPVIVDAGVGTASDAAEAMELGCDGLLINSAIASARDPIAMARAMRLAVEAGRTAYLAGRIEMKLYATASSPLSGLIR